MQLLPEKWTFRKKVCKAKMHNNSMQTNCVTNTNAVTTTNVTSDSVTNTNAVTSNAVTTTNVTSDSDDGYVFSAKNEAIVHNSLPTCVVQIEGEPIRMTIDSGASVNIMDSNTFNKIRRPSNMLFKQPVSKVYPYGSRTPLPVIGIFITKVKFHSKVVDTHVHVVEGTTGNLLGCQTAQDLGILHITHNVTARQYVTTSDTPQSQIIDQFADLFEGAGKVDGVEIKLHIDQDVSPKQQQHRRIPFHIRRDVENTVSYICTSSVPKAMTLQEVEQHYLHDPVMQKLSHAIQSGQWTDEEVTPYLRIQDELAVYRGIVLRHTRIVLPFSLRERAVELAHRGHQGVVKTKSLLREKVWFPGIDAMVEERVKACIPCQATSTHGSEHCTPLKMSHLPDRPWKELSIDFIGPFPTGESLLVVMDDYSRLPEVEIVHSTSSNTVIPKLDAIFARQGIPSELRSDNGPPFNGGEFASFASYIGFKHRRITPLWPGANGEVEHFMRILGKAIRAAFIDQRNWKQELYTFLRQYRATPHSSTGVSPSELLNGRPMKIMLPELRQETQPTGTIDNRDALEKSKMKRNADDRRGAKDSKLSVGDIVLVRQPHKNKLSAPFDSRPLKITARKGNMVTARRGRYTITRNIAHFKSVPLVAFRDGVDDQRENDDDQPVNDNDQPVNDDAQPRPMRRATIPLRFRDVVMHV